MKVVTFGEIMLKLSPQGFNRFMQTPFFDASFGGSEANTAIALSQLGIDTCFVSKLPENDIADACLRELTSFGVDVSTVARGGERMGLYYCEKGAGQRSGKVIYDRVGSSISRADDEDFDWDKAFADADAFHFTGITPALSDSLAEITLNAVKAAKQKGIRVFCDLNYRSSLWCREDACSVMTGLMPYVDCLIANSGSAFDVFGMDESDDTKLAGILAEKFVFDCVALTVRRSSNATENVLGGVLYKSGVVYSSKDISVHIVDRVGGGDCFNAGLIFADLNGFEPQRTIDFAVAANAFKHTVEGDFCRMNFAEVEAVADGTADGRIKR